MEAEHLHFVSDFNGFMPRKRATDLTLSIVPSLHSRHHTPVVRDHSTKSTKGAKSGLLQSASTPRKESFFELQVTSLSSG